jgi:hypothetical protein
LHGPASRIGARSQPLPNMHLPPARFSRLRDVGLARIIHQKLAGTEQTVEIV